MKTLTSLAIACLLAASASIRCDAPKSTTTATTSAAKDPYAGMSASDIAKKQIMDDKSTAAKKFYSIITGSIGFAKDTVPLLKDLPNLVGDTMQCANAPVEKAASLCGRLTKARLDNAGIVTIVPGTDKESRYAFALINLSTLFGKVADGLIGAPDTDDKGYATLKGGLLFPLVSFIAYAQPQRAVLADARNKMIDVRADFAALSKAMKQIGQGLKYAADQKKMKDEAKKEAADNPFAPEPISMDEPMMAPEDAPAESAE